MSDYRVRYETLEFEDFDVHVRSLRDTQEFSDDTHKAERLGISSAMWGIFGVLWPSGRILAKIAHDYDVEGKRVLEVGCGLALASLVLAKRGADITATDYHPEAGSFLEANCELNQCQPIPFVRASWENEGEGEDEALGRFDLIVGSDVLYERDMVAPLVDFINRHANPTCEVLLMDPRRANRGKFSSQMEALGWASSRSDIVGEPDDEPYTGQLLRFVRGQENPPTDEG